MFFFLYLLPLLGWFFSLLEYMRTMQALWVAMTFNDGWKAINPTCHVTKQPADTQCGNSLWPSDSGRPFLSKCARCKQQTAIVVSCPQHEHNFGFCQNCLERSKAELIGPPSPHASTHVYDGVVTHVDWDGRVCISKFLSRRPPKIDVNWKTTTRLNVSTLVGTFVVLV
jgi:hypothetical protein